MSREMKRITERTEQEEEASMIVEEVKLEEIEEAPPVREEKKKPAPPGIMGRGAPFNPLAMLKQQQAAKGQSVMKGALEDE